MVKLISSLIAFITLLTNFFGFNMKIDVTDIKLQKVNGFGTSAAWWAQMVSSEETRNELAKALFSDEGLALNIYRYNVGGGTNPEKNRIRDRSRRTESFYFFNEETGKYEYDLSRDANAMTMLRKALSYGVVDTVVLFANSPHYSMTKNGETFGSNESECNLKEECYSDYVDYFLTITKHFLDEGIPVKYISPFNEPQWSWGGSYANQEGCHYEKEQIEELALLFAKGLKDSGLPVKLMMPESGQIGDAHQWTFDALENEEIKSEIGSYAYHSYWIDGNFQEKVNFGVWRMKEHKNDNFDMTEWCELPCTHDVDDIEAAVLMARTIVSDFSLVMCNSWSNWVAVNGTSIHEDGRRTSDGLFYANGSDYNDVEKTIRYTAFAHFSKFVPAGSVRLQTLTNKREKLEEEWTWSYLTNFAAFRTPEGKKVLVIVNEDETQKIDLCAGIVTKMKVYTTDENHIFEKTYDGRYKRTIEVMKNSITTVVFG